jgi:hypothetical protein
MKTSGRIFLLFAVSLAFSALPAPASGQATLEDIPGHQPQTDRVLIAGGIDNSVNDSGTHAALSSAEMYDQRAEAFMPTGSMNEGRVGHTAVRLTNGQILVAGGDGRETDSPISSAELYDLQTGVFHLTGSMKVARVGHTAVLLRNGLVLVAGGQDETFTNLRSAELFDSSSGTFRASGDMHEARTGHTATLLKTGKVLVAGGENGTSILASAELYDPETGTFSNTGSMSAPRLFATATLLEDGEVLITGGGSIVGGCSGCSVASAEIYDPASGRFSMVGDMHYPRRGHTATRFENNKVLIAGGIDDALPDPQRFLDSAEIFDARTRQFSLISNMSNPRFDHAASLLRDGRVLITGGFVDAFTITNTAEIFDPHSNYFVEAGPMTDARAEHTSTAENRSLSHGH